MIEWYRAYVRLDAIADDTEQLVVAALYAARLAMSHDRERRRGRA